MYALFVRYTAHDADFRSAVALCRISMVSRGILISLIGSRFLRSNVKLRGMKPRAEDCLNEQL